MFAEPLSGFRQATARPQRTKEDWAMEVAHLLDTRYADCERVTLVLRQPQHAHQRGVLRSVRTGGGPCVRESARILLHAEARQLAATSPNAS